MIVIERTLDVLVLFWERNIGHYYVNIHMTYKTLPYVTCYFYFNYKTQKMMQCVEQVLCAMLLPKTACVTRKA